MRVLHTMRDFKAWSGGLGLDGGMAEFMLIPDARCSPARSPGVLPCLRRVDR